MTRTMADPKFKGYTDWKRRHLADCPYIFRDGARTALSRMFLCDWTAPVGRRCIFRWCPLVLRETRP